MEVGSGAATAALDGGGGGAMGVGRGKCGRGRRPGSGPVRVGARPAVEVCVLMLSGESWFVVLTLTNKSCRFFEDQSQVASWSAPLDFSDGDPLSLLIS